MNFLSFTTPGNFGPFDFAYCTISPGWKSFILPYSPPRKISLFILANNIVVSHLFQRGEPNFTMQLHSSRVYSIVKAGNTIWTGSEDTMLNIISTDPFDVKCIKMGVTIKALTVVKQGNDEHVWILCPEGSTKTSNIQVWDAAVRLKSATIFELFFV